MKKLLTNMDKKVAVTTSLEDTKAFLDSMCSQIMRIKEIKADLHRQFVQSMTICLRQIWGYKQLKLEVEKLRQCKVTAERDENKTTNQSKPLLTSINPAIYYHSMIQV